jgi:phosphatidylserine/phosphatidylglycerophosphate/cardiolipin synthase-like enzyme
MSGKKEVKYMIEKHIGPTRQLSKLFENIMDGLPSLDNDNIIRAIPIATPIVDASWCVRIKITPPIGMVERYLLDAVRRFGPMNESEIDELLGLGSARIMFLVTDLISQGAPLSLTSNKIAYTGRGEDPLKEFTKTVEQEFTFIFDGITGDLLPIRFWKNPGETRINIIDQSNNTDSALLSNLLHLRSSIINCNIKPCHNSHNSDAKSDIGLPTGFIDVVDNVPLWERQAWVIAFILIYSSGKTEIKTAGKKPLNIGFPKESLSKYLKLSTRGSSLQWDDAWLTTDLKTDDFRMPQGVAVKHIKNGLLKVSIDHPEDILNWKCLNNKDKDDIKDIAWNLVHGWDWSGRRNNYLVSSIEPGDIKTAENLLLLRGSWRLQVRARELPSLEKVREWWENWQLEQLREWGMKPIVVHNSLVRLLLMAQEIQDQEFREYVLNLQKISTPQNISPSANEEQLFLKSPFGESILKDIESAKKTISIIVPVIDDEQVLGALASARKRGVIIKIITGMKHKQRFRSTGFEGDRDPANQTEVLRRIAEIDLLCRDSNYHPHAKLIVIDDNTAIIASANLTANSLGLHAVAPSLEAGLRFKQGAIPAACIKLFNAIWNSCPFRQALRTTMSNQEETTFDIREEKGDIINSNIIEQRLQGQRLTFSTPGTSPSLGKQLSNMVNMAKRSISISAMTIYDTKHVPCFHKALLQALQRKVVIKVCVRPGVENKFPAKDWPDPSTLDLLNHGLLLYEVDRLHAKGIVVDGEHSGFFSGNLNPFSLDDKCPTGHLEIGLFWDKDKVDGAFAEYSRFIEQLPNQGKKISN